MKSIEGGFAAERFPFGVPMLAKPKSEAWLLCAIQGVPYQNCSRFESLSGNDASPKSAKAALEKVLSDKGLSFTDLCDMSEKGRIAPQQIRMPSFDHFRMRLEEVALGMLRSQSPC